MIYIEQSMEEMPHLATDKQHYYDLELELHQKDSPEEFINHIQSIIKKSHNPQQVKKAIADNEAYNFWVTKNFGKEVLKKTLQ